MKNNFGLVILCCLLGFVQQPAFGQLSWTAARPDGHAPIGILIDHTHKKGEWMLSYRYMHQALQGNQAGTQSVSDAQIYQQNLMSPDRMRMDMHMLMGMYGLTNRLTLMLMLNLSAMQMRMNMQPSGMTMNMPGMPSMSSMTGPMTSRSTGLNDSQLYALYTLADWHQQRLMVSAGLNLPTGSIRQQGTSADMYPNQRLPYMMQAGSGSLDLLPGLTYLGQRSHWSWGGQLSGILRPFYNTIGYRQGNELDLNGWLAYCWSNWISTSLRAESVQTGALKGVDPTLYTYMEPAANPANYGGQRVSGYVGINFYVRHGLFKGNRLAIEAGLPLYQNLNGTQMPLQSTLYAGWQRAF